MKRGAIAKGAALGILVILIAAGAVGIYYYTMAPAGTSTVSTSSGQITTSTSAGSANNGTQQGPAGGNCTKNASGQCTNPQGAWADYLGYIPSGYVLSPHYPNAPQYPCPPGMGSTQCAQFQASCGNGVCDPNESCQTCPIDCGVSGQLTCDPYTGRSGAPISICQVGGGGGAGG
jgi:hypothetical protein